MLVVLPIQCLNLLSILLIKEATKTSTGTATATATATATDNTPLLEFRNVTFRYDNAESPALENISFTVYITAKL